MKKNVLISVRMLILFTILTGVIYPLAVTGISQAFLSRQANGSLIDRDGSVVGSGIIGQRFTQAKYFHSRPSKSGKDGYDPMHSGGSNLSVSNPDFISMAVSNREAVQNENMNRNAVPNDMIMSSASGLDPDISLESAVFQAKRVAVARNVSEEQVISIINKVKEEPLAGIIGEEKVNVLELNLELDKSIR
jgi:potassium-transporting ATPase KdpC subunit